MLSNHLSKTKALCILLVSMLVISGCGADSGSDDGAESGPNDSVLTAEDVARMSFDELASLSTLRLVYLPGDEFLKLSNDEVDKWMLAIGRAADREGSKNLPTGGKTDNDNAQQQSKSIQEWSQTIKRNANPEQVIAQIGRPDSTSESGPNNRWLIFEYRGRVMNQHTGKTETLRIAFSYKSAWSVKEGYSGKELNLPM